MLGQVSLTAGRLTGEIAEGGGSRIGMMCGCSAANGNSVKIFSDTSALTLLKIHISRSKVAGRQTFKVLRCNKIKPKLYSLLTTD